MDIRTILWINKYGWVWKCFLLVCMRPSSITFAATYVNQNNNEIIVDKVWVIK
jgi:hypothetical protein